MVKQFLLVFIGGGLGSILRFALTKVINTDYYSFGTLSVNVIGGFILGFLLGYSLKDNIISQNLILLLGTGFCGGFTTFSAFSYENAIFLKEGNLSMVLLYILLSIILGILAVFTGIWINRFL